MIPGCKAEVTRSRGYFFRMDRFYTGYLYPPPTLPRDVLAWLRWHNDRIAILRTQWIVFGRQYRRQTACSRHFSDAEEENVEVALVDTLTDLGLDSDDSFQG
jgi:hypothetical protein